jgi:hypothetical protein
MAENEQVRVEMETFLEALATYPARFAADPSLTFEECRLRLMAALPTAPTPPGPVRAKAKASGL